MANRHRYGRRTREGAGSQGAARLPRLGGALQRGEISYAKVRALTRVATPDNEERLLRLAYHATASQVERVARAWRRFDRLEEAREERQQRLARSSKDAAAPDSIIEEVSWAQRQADALGLLAECALRADLDRGTAGDRYQVVVHVDAGDAEDSKQAVVELDEGPIRVSAETSRRLACDASVVVMREGPDGTVLDVGRRTRTVPTPIRRALTARIPAAAFPGAPRAGATLTTSRTGQMAAPRRSTI